MLARGESGMSKELIVSATSLETKVAILEDDQVTQVFIERDRSKSILGNIYKGKVTRVLPGMQAAFVDIGLERNAFLYVSDFFEDYEDYEELFDKADKKANEFLLDQEESEGKPKRRGRRPKKTPPRKTSPENSQEETPKSADHKASENTGGTIPKAQCLPMEDPGLARILPEFLSFESPLQDPSQGLTQQDEDLRDDQIRVLPDRLPPIGKAAEKRNEKDCEARLGTNLDVHHLRAANKENSRKQGSSRKSELLIGDLLREGQEILVQVAKEPIGKKGARITSHIVLPGRYLVFMPTVDHIGVSRRIESTKERQRLKSLVSELRGDLAKGFIVRTAGEGRSKKDFGQDLDYLTGLWESIRAKAENKAAPTLIYTELDLVQRIIRDYFTDEYRSIRVDDEAEYERIVEFISNFNPKLVKKVRPYNRNIPIFDEFQITPELEKALKSKVWLRNGGYIVINQTEALVAIDVNTGKYVGRTNSLEDTITRTNLDAVREVARQIRLRDLGGIIVIDFIDMDDLKNQRKVMDALEHEMAKDKAPSKILPFNEFGLIAVTRKRVKQSLERALCQPCSTCEGTGFTKSVRTVCYIIHQEIRRALPKMGESREIIVRCHPDVAKALTKTERLVAEEIEEMTGKELTVRSDPLMLIDQFDLVES